MKLGVENMTELHLKDKPGVLLTVAKCHDALWADYLLAAVRLAHRVKRESDEWNAEHQDDTSAPEIDSELGEFIAARSRLEGIGDSE